MLHTAETSTQGLARCLRKARQSLQEALEDTQMVLFANMGMKHASIAMADVGARVVHASLRSLRMQALRVGTGTHGCGPDALTKDIPVASSSLFGESSHCFPNYKALGDCFVLSGFSRPKSPRGKKGKASVLPFQGKNRPSYSQGHSSQPTGLGRGGGPQRARAPTGGKPRHPQWQ